MKIFTLQTECQHEIWSGFFGVNANGDQLECNQEITVEVEGESIEWDDYGVRPCYSTDCPACGSVLGWPQDWVVVDVRSKPAE